MTRADSIRDHVRAASIQAVHELESREPEPSVEQYVDTVLGALGEVVAEVIEAESNTRLEKG